MNAGQALGYGRASLVGESDTPARDAALLLAYVLDRSPEHAYLHPEEPVNDCLCSAYFDLIARRRLGEPIAYLRGVREFMGLEFKVDRRALIPRPETEFVVETLLRLLAGEYHTRFSHGQSRPAQPDHKTLPGGGDLIVADICCGSGAIGLSIAKYLPCAKVVVSDVSRGAVDLARENAERLGVGAGVSFLVGDLLEPLVDLGMSGKVDALAANPPYIAGDEMDALPRDVRDFEPRLALDGGRTGLDLISRIAREAPAVLKPGALLVMEIGADQGDACRRIFDWAGLWQGISVLNDYAGRQRVVVGRTRCAG